MSISTILAAIKTWLTGAEQWFEALFSKLIREEQALIPVVESFIEKAQAFISSPGAVTIEALIPDGIGTEIASIANEALAWILSELTSISGEVITASVAGSGVPVLANPDAVAKTAFQKISQAGPDAQTHFLTGYSTMLLQKFAPSGANITYEEGVLATVVPKLAATPQPAA